jgi:putative ABC transport system permease protein
MLRGLGLGLRLLVFSKGRLLAAAAGVAMAVAIMFVELGLLLGVLDSQALMAQLVRGDLIAVHEGRSHLHKWTEIDEIRLGQIGALPEVAAVVPVYQTTMGLRSPDDQLIRRIVVYAFPPEEAPLRIGDAEEIARLLKVSGTIMFDRRSRPVFGRITPGLEVELDGMRHRVAGLVDIGPDIVHDGSIVMGLATWRAREPHAHPLMGVIRLKPGVAPAAAKARIAAALPRDVTILTPEEARRREIEFTLRSAPIGVLFGVGMLAGLVIGVVTCYQVLFNEVVDRLKQYATLKAMGFSGLFLRRVILEQALLLAVVGFAIGLGIALVAYRYIADATSLSLAITPVAALGIFGATAGMCAVAALLAVRRVTAADPAALY